MSRKILISIILLSCLTAQRDQTTAFASDGRHATPEALANRPKNALGFPDRSPGMDVFPGFQSPPEGYGQVPLYWWVGETLTKVRMLWQLDQLDRAGIQGFSVSYPHSHQDIDSELNRGGSGLWGMTLPSEPPIFSQEWWELWDWFAGECAKRNMGVGLDDYTLCTPGNRQWPDDIAALPKMKDYPGKLVFVDKDVKGGESLRMEIPATAIAVSAFRKGQNENLWSQVRNGVLNWNAPSGSDWRVVVVSTGSGFMLHPEHGSEVIARYFQNFEDHVSPENRKGLNFFFQDELTVDMDLGTWSEDFVEVFERQKGYDIRPLLGALKHDIGPMTVKVRLDYWDVATSLAEERYFKPIFDWHWKRGLIYGCDNVGRGLNPTAYGDYFQATRWYTAPGNDAPMGDTALVQTKVNSSVAHLYNRPRVWLEAFHSMGWDARPAQIHEATEKHFLLGGNLLCLHGLYYTTYGGFWEWAPPDFHFRMPYWPHMMGWLKYVERLSYLLSQGVHVADVAIVYPVAPLQAGNGGTTDAAWEAARVMFDAGLDFDFIDHQSLARAMIENGQLVVAGESYRVLILPDMTAVHFTTLEQAKAFKEGGGLVLSIGGLPTASDRAGSDDPKLDTVVKAIFTDDATLGGKIRLIPEIVSDAIRRDFGPQNQRGHVVHRRIGQRDVYMVMDVPQGTECFFRAKGKAELWDPWTGESELLPIERETSDGSYLRIPNVPPSSSVIVFSPGEPQLAKTVPSTKITTIPIEGEWESELVPTMDNQWGDFRQPPGREFIGPEAREFKYAPAEQAGEGWVAPTFDDSTWRTVRNTFGPQMYMLHLPGSADPEQAAKHILDPSSGKDYPWQAYEFSWRWGVQDQPGSQGYHGLKKKVSDDFLILGEVGHYFFRTHLVVERDTRARIERSGSEPAALWLDEQPVSGSSVELTAGPHDLLIAYHDIKEGALQHDYLILDERTRSAVVFIEEDAEEAISYPLAMRWYRQPGRLPYDLYAGQEHAGCYRFTAPPGLQSMSFDVNGSPEVWIDGEQAELIVDDGQVKVALSATHPQSSLVAIRVTPHAGAHAGAAFPAPIKLTCGIGEISTGDWSQMGVLKHYSGGLWYRKDIPLTPEQTEGKLILDLGQVVASAEVWVNGKKAGVCITDPFQLEVTDYVKPGDNHVAILVYNTLSNHYQTIPTPQHYKKTTTSGLLGPVQLVQMK